VIEKGTFMPKGYWIVRVDVSDNEVYGRYIKANAAPIARHGGRFLVRGGRHEAVEGTARARNVVIEFPSYDAALACFRDPDYQAAKAIRDPVTEAEIVVIEGYDGPQPGD
jgi:uncharacterized protein (DUF1330 family)